MTVINGLWIGERLSPLERACAQSFLQNGYEFHLYVYDTVANVPDGCVLRDAAEIISADEIFVHQSGVAKGSLATFSNLFRFELLLARGGWWMDMDMYCLTAGLPDDGIVIGRQDPQLINDAVLRFPAGHALLRTAATEARAKGIDADWTEIGPALLTRLLESDPLADAVFPAPVFYPIHFSQFWIVLDPRRTAYALERIRGAACLHFWNEMWRRANLDKNILPPEGSLLRGLYEATIGTAGFTREYVLAPNCPDDLLQLRVIERR
jgi:hypothetical protein